MQSRKLQLSSCLPGMLLQIELPPLAKQLTPQLCLITALLRRPQLSSWLHGTRPLPGYPRSKQPCTLCLVPAPWEPVLPVPPLHPLSIRTRYKLPEKRSWYSFVPLRLPPKPLQSATVSSRCLPPSPCMPHTLLSPTLLLCPSMGTLCLTDSSLLSPAFLST